MVFLLFTWIGLGSAMAQDRIEFKANVFDTGGAPDQMKIMVRSWPIKTRIDRVRQTITIKWPGDAPPEVLPLSRVTHLERARPYEQSPDELFAILNTGRRILLCQGPKTAEIVKLASAVVGREVLPLPMGEGHATRPPSAPPSPILELSAGGTSMSTVSPQSDPFAQDQPTVTGERAGASIDGVSASTVEKKTVDSVIKQHMPLFRQCYEVALVEQPNLSGKVTVGFVIVGSGAVGAATIQASTLDNKSVESCVRQKVMSIRFPAPKGNTTTSVSFPFVFTSL